MIALDLQDVDPARFAEVGQDAITVARRQWSRDNRRPKALTAREALAVLKFEALLVGVAAANILHGEELTEGDFERLALAVRRINTISSEAL